jgi:hypothetical protein
LQDRKYLAVDIVKRFGLHESASYPS